MRTTLLSITAIAAAFVSSPALSQSFFPNLTGAQFCQLRSMGVSYDEAMDAAMRSNWSSYRTPIYVTSNGRRITTDVVEFASYIVNVCPQYRK